MPDPTTAIFLQIDAPGRMPGVHWQASLYFVDAAGVPDLPFPVAVAWLSDYRAGFTRSVVLDFILVPDQHRRQGYATALIAACRERWPELVLTEAISEAGEALVAKMEREATA